MTQIDRFTRNFWRGFAIVIIGLLLWSLCSCSTAKSDTRKAYKIHYRNPLVLARYCADNYPPKDSTSIVKEYIQGEDVVFTDTLIESYTDLDTVYLTKIVTKTVKVTDTIRDTKFIKQTDKALTRLLSDSLANKNIELALNTKKISNKNKELWFWRILAGCFVVYKIARAYLNRYKLIGKMR